MNTYNIKFKETDQMLMLTRLFIMEIKIFVNSIALSTQKWPTFSDKTKDFELDCAASRISLDIFALGDIIRIILHFREV